VDTNNDDVLTTEEFLEWGAGYLYVAESTGKTEQLNAAKQEVFKLMDINGDGRLEHDEFSTAALYDFYRADKNSDGVLSQDEFIGEYRMVKTVRSAVE
jgi:Ca2+-binding EF-hand superfamily protein